MYYIPPKLIFVPKKNSEATRIPVGETMDIRHINATSEDVFTFNSKLEEDLWFLKEMKKDIAGLEKSKEPLDKDIENQETALRKLRIALGPSSYNSKGIKAEENKLIHLYNKKEDLVKKLQKEKASFEKGTTVFINLSLYYVGKDFYKSIDNNPSLHNLKYRKRSGDIMARMLKQFIMEAEDRYFLYYKNNGEFGIRGLT